MPQIHVNGIKMYYEAAGEGTPLVLLHGLGSSCQDWPLQMADFSRRYYVIAPDCRGHGGSEKPPGPYSIGLFAQDVATLLTHLGASRFHVLGISMGGLVAQQLALDSGERVKSLVLVNTFSHFDLSGIGGLVALLRRAFVLRVFSMARIGQFVGKQLFPRPEQEILRKLAAQRWAQNDKAAYQAASLAIWRFNVTQRLREIYCPTLIIVGADDRTVSLAHSEVLMCNIAGSQRVIVPDSTHATPIDQPQTFNQAVFDFLATVPD